MPGTDLAIGLEELASKHAGNGSHPLDTTTKINVAAAFPSGAHIAEVEIDPDTGMLDIVSYMAVDDCGRVYNHTIVEGQLRGGLDAGHRPDDRRALRLRPRQRPVPDRHVHGLLHAARRRAAADSRWSIARRRRRAIRSASRARARPAPPAAIPTIANAVMDALRPLGIHALDTPYTPFNVWAAIQARNA